MLNEKDTKFIKNLATEVAALTAKLEEAKERRDEGVRVALDSGGGATELSRLTGLTRGRIYQIKEHRR
jgi:hypothetical protein